MSSVTDIKQAIMELSKAEYAEIVEWLYELEEEAWDRQIEEDAKSGRLDALATEAWEAKANGTLMEL